MSGRIKDMAMEENKGHPLLFTIFVMFLIFGGFVGVMFLTGNIVTYDTRDTSKYFSIEDKDVGDTFFEYTYEVTVLANKDMDSLTLVLEYHNEEGVCLGQVTKEMLNLDEGSKYVFSFSLPLDSDLKTVSVDPDDAIID